MSELSEMRGSIHATMIAAGTGARARPTLARVEIDGDALRIAARPYLDPMQRSGRGGSSGLITGLSQVVDAAGGAWLLASVERGRPRLLAPERLAVLALLGRRREWRGAADSRSPFLPVICARPPRSTGAGEFVLCQDPRGAVDLLRLRPGAALERWALGELGRRAELFASESALAIVAGDRLAALELAQLGRGGCPLGDPREVELALAWQPLPPAVVGVCDLLDAPRRLRALERDGERFCVVELELRRGAEPLRRASWAIEAPQRWLSAGASLWLASAEAWTHVVAGEGPRERSTSLAGPSAAATVELDADARPWLWLWDRGLGPAGELLRVDGLTLDPRGRWPLAAALDAPLRPQQLLALRPGPAGDPATIVHADELAELRALAPELGEAWPTWFDRLGAVP